MGIEHKRGRLRLPLALADRLVSYCLSLNRLQFFCLFLVVSVVSALSLTVATWYTLYGVFGIPVVNVGLVVTLLVAVPILLFLSKVFESLERSNAELTAKSDVETRLGRLLQTSYDEVYVFAQDTLNFIEVNESARNNLGYSSEEMRGLTALDLKPFMEPEDFNKKIARLLEGTTELEVFETQHRRKNGTTYPVEVRLQLSRSERPPVFLGIVQDITERHHALRKLRQAMEQAESASRAKSSFLANMSHELRTPLNAILGFSDILKNQMFGPVGRPQYAEYAEDIHQSGEHLLQIINDILDLSKVEVGEQKLEEKPVDVGVLAEACKRLVSGNASKAGVSLRIEVADNLPEIQGDELKLKQVLINLLSNAVKFTEEGGRVTVSAGLLATGEVEMAVSDTGIGMDPADIPAALAVFGQVDSSLSRKYEGTGLGLPLAKALVEQHGGSLSIESALGEGTTVRFTIPAAGTLQTQFAAVGE